MTTRDHTPITRALLDLDASDSELDAVQRTRAAATLERILASDPDGDPDGAASVPGPVAARGRAPRRRVPRLVLSGGLVTAVAAAVVGVPLLTGGSEAFASWSPTPVELTGTAREVAVNACLVLQGSEEGQLAFDPDADASVLVAEARGGWSDVIFTVASSSGGRLQGSCLVPDELLADPRPGEGGFFGGLGGAEETAGRAPAPGVVRQDAYGVGSVEDEAFVYAEGRAGAGVAGIEITTGGGRVVEASLDHGRWAVWWPVGGDAMDDPEVTEAPSYEVTLRDGTVSTGINGPS